MEKFDAFVMTTSTRMHKGRHSVLIILFIDFFCSLFVFADAEASMESVPNVKLLRVAATNEVVSPIVYTIPLQLLAYHVAIIKGTDVDQPRNLAKSVTVE